MLAKPDWQMDPESRAVFSTLRHANTASPATRCEQYLIKLRVLKKCENGQRKRQQVKGLESQAGYTPLRAKNPKGTWLGKLRVQAESEETRAKIQKPGWLHALAWEPSQPGKWIQKAKLAPRSGVRTQPARQQGLNNNAL